MKTELNKITKDLEQGNITEQEARKLLLGLFGVSCFKNYVVITPKQSIITVEKYMETDDYNNKLEQQIDDFMTNKKEKELIELFKKK